MNAAARLVHQGTLTRQLMLVHFLTRKQLSSLILSLLVVFSALATIYVTHVTRELHANLQQQIAEQEHLHVERGQLLLERSTWMVQSRIQHIAETKLGMIVPNHKSVVIIHE